MISFGKFCDILDQEVDLLECAKLMSISEKDPKEIVESVLDVDILESWKSWLGNLGRAAGQVAGGIGAGVAAGGQKVMQGVSQAVDTASGPLSKFEKAIDVLKDLEKVLRTNPATKGVASQSAPKSSIAGYIQAIYRALEKERSSMPQMAGSNRFPHENPTKYLRGSEIQKRQEIRQKTGQPQQPQAQPQQPQTQPQQPQSQQNQNYPPMRLAQ